MISKREWLDIFSTLEAAFGPQAEARLQLYGRRFADTDPEALKCAIARCIDECHYFPTVADIVERMPGHSSADDEAARAWGMVLREVECGLRTEYNPYSGTAPTGERLPPLAFRAAGGAGGLARIESTMNDAKQLSFMRRDFMEAYAAHAAMDTPAMLAGTADIGRLESRGQPRTIGQIMGVKDDKHE